jgi:AraC-like DNA-binding protein
MCVAHSPARSAVTARVSRSRRPTVIAAVADEEWRTHVQSLLDPCFELTILPNVRLVHEVTPDLVLWHLGSAEDADDACVAALRRLRVRSARTIVVAYCRISVPVAPLLVVAGRVGVDRLLLRGHDDLRAGLRRELEDHGLEAISREVIARLALPDGEAWQVVAHCVRRAATTVLTVEALAEEFGLSRRTLHNRLRAAGLPSPEQVIGWTRLLLAAAMLQVPSGSVASIAARLGFSSESALRGMLVRYMGVTPRELRRADGFARVVSGFRTASMRLANNGLSVSAVDFPLSV